MNEDREVVEWNKNSQTKSDSQEYVTIYSQNQIAIPSFVYEKYFNGEDAAIIQFAENTEEIGIVPSDSDHPNSYSLGDGTPTINCKSFLEAYDLLVEESTKYPISNDNGTLWVDTTSPLND